MSPAPQGLRAVAQLAKPCVAIVKPWFSVQWTSEVITEYMRSVEEQFLAVEQEDSGMAGSNNLDNCVGTMNPVATGSAHSVPTSILTVTVHVLISHIWTLMRANR